MGDKNFDHIKSENRSMQTLPQSENFLGLEDSQSSFENAQAVILPIPYEGTTTYIKGTADGPAAILQASQQVEYYDDELGSEPCMHGIATAEPLPFAGQSHKQALAKIGTAAQKIMQTEKFFVGIGGEHSITIPIVRHAVEIFDNLSVLQLDAHSDLRDSYEGSPLNHACVMARVNECCDFVSVGLRSGIIGEQKNIRPGAKLIYAREMVGNSDWQQAALAALSENVYLTFDLDFLGTPEPGGFHWYQTLAFLKRVFAEKNVVACDVVELCPMPNVRHADFLAAKLVYKLIGYKFLHSSGVQ